jgi:hypothetical protein
MRFVVLSTLLACGPPCLTPCGTAFAEKPECESLAAHEAHTLQAFENYVAGWSTGRTCEALEGTRIDINEQADERGTWPNGCGRTAGLVLYESNTIVLGTTDWKRSAYAHEVAHLLEWRLDGVEDLEHEGWVKKQIRRAESEANAP